MKVLAQQDFLEVRLASLIADFDRDTLSNLYQPMIGYEALALYMTLWSEANNERVSPLCNHEQVLLRMRIGAASFVDARKNLEATGLLKTFVSEGQDYRIYHYELYAPKSPRGFFDDALLYGMLIKSIGENNATRLKNIYVVEPKQDYGQEITASFAEVFHPEFNDMAFLNATNNEQKMKGRNIGKIKGSFSYEKFFLCLNEVSQIKDTAITKEEMKEVERLATLYGVDEENVAIVVSQIYEAKNHKGQRINLTKLDEILQTHNEHDYPVVNDHSIGGMYRMMAQETDLAKKVAMMEKFSPKDYLASKQQGAVPALADLKILNDLSKKYHLSNGVINAIVDYVLYKADNILSRSYAERVASSMVRENVQTAVDAMNYLKKVEKKTRGRKSKTIVKEINNEKVDEKQDDNKDWELDWDRLIDELNGGDKGGKA